MLMFDGGLREVRKKMNIEVFSFIPKRGKSHCFHFSPSPLWPSCQHLTWPQKK